MLKLHHLDISGFKTFVDPVTTAFSPGITAIVGPNGCGKSNLSEAVTWVLGEQSAKSLRGARMEDVIFSGSERRRALGMAEVSLTFQGAEQLPGADEDGMITIGRRVFRTGESQYRLNDKVVRLKEIKDMLMDTGLGVRAYSVIEQGRIGMILSGKPQDRRKLIEEAAGITRYKARKRVAEIKLEEATANLIRLDDIIAEVERALRSLKRQASSARRYREREALHRELLEAVLLGRAGRMHRELAALEHRLEQALAADAELGARLSGGEQKLAEARRQLDDLGQELAEKHQHQADIAATIEGRQEFLRGSRDTLQEIDERLEGGRELARQRRQELQAAQDALLHLASRGAELLDERERAHADVAEDEKRMQAALEHIRSAETEREGLRSRLMSSMNRVTSVQNRLHQEQIESEKGSFRRQHLVTELETKARLLAEADEALAKARQRVQELEKEREHERERERSTRETLDHTLLRESEVALRRKDAEAELDAVDKRAALLDELARVEDERRTKLREAMAAVGLDHLPFLDDRVTVPEGWENSLDLFLEQLRDAVLLPAQEDPMVLADALSATDSSGTLLRAANGGRRTVAPRPYDSAIIASLPEALGLAPEFGDSLPPAYLVETREDAARLARVHPGVAFLSRDRLWAQGGVLHLQGNQATPGSLRRKSELEEIGQRRPELRTQIEGHGARLDELVAERTALAATQNRLEARIGELSQELAVAEARQQDATATQNRLRHDHQGLVDEEGEVGREIERHSQRRSALQQELEQCQREHSELEQTFDRAQKAVEEAREQLQSLKTDGAGRQGLLQLLQERVDSHETEQVRLRRQRDEVNRFLQEWHDQESSLDERRRGLDESMNKAEGELQQGLERRDLAEAETRAGREKLDLQRDEVQRLAAEVDRLRAQRESERDGIEALRVERATERQELGHLEATFREAFHRELPYSADSSTGETAEGPAIPPEPENFEELEEELARTKAALESMGPVNVLAAQEYEDQEERFTFLSEQRADVMHSVQSLKATIREINETSLERFVATFEEVNERFGTTFQQLFRGGEAMMRIMDDEDPLESGLEIVARPPGKRPQNINLLSGGEKALTAIALLFALFRTKPSPFCILDEVDAPLDDANVLRFVELLRDMTDETQFLVITHNKLTMEAASTLYGVTMEERGVSKIVGVEVDNLHPVPALAS